MGRTAMISLKRSQIMVSLRTVNTINRISVLTVSRVGLKIAQVDSMDEHESLQWAAIDEFGLLAMGHFVQALSRSIMTSRIVCLVESRPGYDNFILLFWSNREIVTSKAKSNSCTHLREQCAAVLAARTEYASRPALPTDPPGQREL